MELEEEPPSPGFGLCESGLELEEHGSPDVIMELEEKDGPPDFGPFEPRLELEDGSPHSPGLGLCESGLELEEQGSPELIRQLEEKDDAPDFGPLEPRLELDLPVVPTFVEWLHGLSEDDRLAITEDYQSFMEAREVRLGLRPQVGVSQRKKSRTPNAIGQQARPPSADRLGILCLGPGGGLARFVEVPLVTIL